MTSIPKFDSNLNITFFNESSNAEKTKEEHELTTIFKSLIQSGCQSDATLMAKSLGKVNLFFRTLIECENYEEAFQFAMEPDSKDLKQEALKILQRALYKEISASTTKKVYELYLKVLIQNDQFEDVKEWLKSTAQNAMKIKSEKDKLFCSNIALSTYIGFLLNEGKFNQVFDELQKPDFIDDAREWSYDEIGKFYISQNQLNEAKIYVEEGDTLCFAYVEAVLKAQGVGAADAFVSSSNFFCEKAKAHKPRAVQVYKKILEAFLSQNETKKAFEYLKILSNFSKLEIEEYGLNIIEKQFAFHGSYEEILSVLLWIGANCKCEKLSDLRQWLSKVAIFYEKSGEFDRLEQFIVNINISGILDLENFGGKAPSALLSISRELFAQKMRKYSAEKKLKEALDFIDLIMTEELRHLALVELALAFLTEESGVEDVKMLESVVSKMPNSMLSSVAYLKLANAWRRLSKFSEAKNILLKCHSTIEVNWAKFELAKIFIKQQALKDAQELLNSMDSFSKLFEKLKGYTSQDAADLDEYIQLLKNFRNSLDRFKNIIEEQKASIQRSLENEKRLEESSSCVIL